MKNYIIKQLIISFIRLYQVSLSHVFSDSCIFSPTCSFFAIEAIEKHGVLAGSWKTLLRLLRCNPLNKRHGYDPVP